MSKKASYKLRAFFVRKINDEYNSYIRTLSTKDDIVLANGIVERFDFCIKHDLVTCLASHNNGSETVVTADVFEDLRKIKIEKSEPSLKDLASMIGGKFESCGRRINGVKTKVASGSSSRL